MLIPVLALLLIVFWVVAYKEDGAWEATKGVLCLIVVILIVFLLIMVFGNWESPNLVTSVAQYLLLVYNIG